MNRLQSTSLIKQKPKPSDQRLFLLKKKQTKQAIHRNKSTTLKRGGSTEKTHLRRQRSSKKTTTKCKRKASKSKGKQNKKFLYFTKKKGVEELDLFKSFGKARNQKTKRNPQKGQKQSRTKRIEKTGKPLSVAKAENKRQGFNLKKTKKKKVVDKAEIDKMMRKMKRIKQKKQLMTNTMNQIDLNKRGRNVKIKPVDAEKGGSQLVNDKVDRMNSEHESFRSMLKPKLNLIKEPKKKKKSKMISAQIGKKNQKKKGSLKDLATKKKKKAVIKGTNKKKNFLSNKNIDRQVIQTKTKRAKNEPKGRKESKVFESKRKLNSKKKIVASKRQTSSKPNIPSIGEARPMPLNIKEESAMHQLLVIAEKIKKNSMKYSPKGQMSVLANQLTQLVQKMGNKHQEEMPSKSSSYNVMNYNINNYQNITNFKDLR